MWQLWHNRFHASLTCTSTYKQPREKVEFKVCLNLVHHKNFKVFQQATFEVNFWHNYKLWYKLHKKLSRFKRHNNACIHATVAEHFAETYKTIYTKQMPAAFLHCKKFSFFKNSFSEARTVTVCVSNMWLFGIRLIKFQLAHKFMISRTIFQRWDITFSKNNSWALFLRPEKLAF